MAFTSQPSPLLPTQLLRSTCPVAPTNSNNCNSNSRASAINRSRWTSNCITSSRSSNSNDNNSSNSSNNSNNNVNSSINSNSNSSSLVYVAALSLIRRSMFRGARIYRVSFCLHSLEVKPTLRNLQWFVDFTSRALKFILYPNCSGLILKWPALWK